jgi:hypothetical protein
MMSQFKKSEYQLRELQISEIVNNKRIKKLKRKKKSENCLIKKNNFKYPKILFQLNSNLLDNC